MMKWSHKHTLSTGLILIGFLAIVSGGAFLFGSKLLSHGMAALALGDARDLEDSQALRLIGFREVSDVGTALLTGDPVYVQAARSGSAAMGERVARVLVQTPDQQGRTLVDQIEKTERGYQEAFEQAFRAPGGRPTTSDIATVASRGQALELALDALVAHTAPAAAGGIYDARASLARTQTIINSVTSITLIAIALAAMLCVLLILLTNRIYREQSSARVLAEEGQTRTTTALREEKEASQLKDEFLATVSHELRNPLAPILAWTQLLRGGTLEKEKVDRGLEVIERSVVSLSQLIDDLLDVSRVVAGKYRLDVRPVDLVPVIRAAVESQRPAIDAKHIRMQIVVDERAGLISGDSERLQQVMGNLLSNAVKFTPKGGSVQVTLRRAESHVEMAISDSGIGIDARFLPHVFEPFQQAVDGSMRRHGGLGLGLSIVRHIVELHGGEILAESPGPGRGASFTVKLPLLGTSVPKGATRSNHPWAADGLADVKPRRLDNVRVLLVDDEPTANEALETLLDSSGAEVRVAGSAAQALQTLDVWLPDVLISDIAMPEEDGYSLIRKIRARSPARGGNIPAAALTAYAKIEDRVNILAAGFQMYLSKPANPSELLAVVASLAARRDGLVAPEPGASSNSG